MTEVNIDTGIKPLDDDLRKVFEVASPKKRQEIKSAIANYDLSTAQLFEIVPKAILRVAIGLRNPAMYQATRERVKEESRHYLEEARDLVEQHFVDILKHPAALSAAIDQELEEEDQHSFSEALNAIANIRHVPLWMGQAPRMQPTSRVAFFGKGQKLLLDSTFDWEDYLYVATTLTGMLICEMESGRVLAELGQTELPYKTQMEDRIEKLEKHLIRIRELGGAYGLNLDSEKPTIKKRLTKEKDGN